MPPAPASGIGFVLAVFPATVDDLSVVTTLLQQIQLKIPPPFSAELPLIVDESMVTLPKPAVRIPPPPPHATLPVTVTFVSVRPIPPFRMPPPSKPGSPPDGRAPHPLPPVMVTWSSVS